MAATIYTLDQTPVLSEILDSGDTVTVTIYNKATGASVPLDASSCTEIGSTGVYRYTVDMTTEPEYGQNTYIYIFSGTLQKRYGEFNWIDDVSTFEGKIWIDTVSGSAGTAYPLGNSTNPVSNLANALTIAARYGFKRLHIRGAITLASSFDDWSICADSANLGTVNLANQSVADTVFCEVTLSGIMNGAVYARNVILDTVTNLEGDFFDVVVATGISIKAGGEARLDGGRVAGAIPLDIDLNGTGSFAASKFTHYSTIKNLTSGAYACVMYGTGWVTIDSTVTSGVVVMGDSINVINNGTPAVYINQTSHFLVWDELLANHVTALTTGANQNLIDDIKSTVDTNLNATVSSRAIPGDDMNLADDAITASKYDETTAYPLKSDDSGSTEIARTGADGDTLETLSDQIDGTAVPGSDMNLADDAITSAKYDETTAYPLKSDDSGSTQVARTGADADTLETLSDQIDLTALEANVEGHVTTALNTYDPPTKAELDTAETNIIAEIDANEVKIDAIQVATDQLNFSGSNVLADLAAISGDGGAADNLESTYDGTGYTDDYAPAQQQQLDQLALTGAAINTPSNSDSTLTTGSTISGDYTETSALDAVYWQIADAAGTLDMYYEFGIPADGVPTSATITGRINGNLNDLDVFAWNWGGAAWEQIGIYAGQGSAVDVKRSYDLFTTHVGTGANLGKVRIRFYGTGLTSANFYTDQIFLSYAVVTRSVGYADGAIWVDTNNGSAGTTSYINGTADNPVDSWADALTLSGNLGLIRFHVVGGSSITLTANSDNYAILGAEYTLALGGQSVANAYIEGATVSGTSAGTNCRFIDCKIGACSLIACGFGRCAFMSNITLLSANTYLFEGCFSAIGGSGNPSIDFGAAIANTNVVIRHYSGGIEVKNMGQSGIDTVELEGDGELVINVNCTGGTIYIRGNFPVTDNAGGAVTLSDDARFTRSEVSDEVHEEALSGHTTVGSTGEALNLLDDIESDTSSIKSTVDTNLDAAVSSRAIPGDNMNLADDAITNAKYDESTAFPIASVDSGSTEIARTGADGDTLETLSDQIDGAAVPGSAMNLADDAITSAKYDETTAYPVKSDDSGLTEIARTGADGDTLETISDQIDPLAIEANVEGHVTDALDTYDPPTKAELDTVETNIIAEIDANEVKIDANLTRLNQMNVAVESTAASGSTTTEIRTGLTQANDFFNNMQVVVINSAGVAVRNIDDFANTNGAITVTALPFTPSVADPVIILARTGSVPVDVNAIADGVWEEDVTTHLGGSKAGQYVSDIDAGVTNIEEATIAVETIAASGSSTTEIRTGLTQADDFFNDMQVLVVNSSGVAVRNIDDFANINGAITVTALPFTPAISDPVIIIGRVASGVGGGGVADWTSGEKEQIRDAMGVDGSKTTAVSGQLQTIDTNVDSIKSTVDTNLDVVVSTRATPAQVKTQADQALVDYDPPTKTELDTAETNIIAEIDANEVKIDAIPADVDTELTSSHGAGSWQSATSVDWTAGEKEEIRDALGVTGTKSTASGGQVQDIKTKTDNLPTDPADQSLVEAAITTSEGNIRGGSDTLDSLSDQLDGIPSAAGITDAVWQEPFSGYTTNTQMGYLMNKFLRALIVSDAKQLNNQWIVYDPDAPATPLVTHNTFDSVGSPADVFIYKREKV